MSDLLNQASLVVIPSGYKEDTVYSVVPSDGSGDLSFTRASNGTRINSAGLVEVCPWNLVQYSEQFDNAYWTKVDCTVTADSTTAPNGTSTADSLLDNTSNFIHALTPALSKATTEITYTHSVYAKFKDTDRKIQLSLDDAVSGGVDSGVFNLTTGVWDTALGTPSAAFTNPSRNFENVGNGWYRISLTVTSNAGSQIRPNIFVINGSNASLYIGNGTGIYIWGAQLVVGSTAKPYFPTTDRLNVPRLTYQNGGGGCPSLLLEKQSTNLTLYSEQLDNAAHSQLNVTITANNITSPDGTQNADKITETTGTGEHIVYDIDTNATGTYTLSAFFKGGEGTIYPVLRLNGSNTTGYAGCIFNTSTGAVVNTFYNTYSAPTTKVENMGNGWYRVSMTTTTTDANFGMRIAASNSASPSIGAYGAISYTGSTSNYFYAYGAQLEASSYPTSYIPTTSSSATRVADECRKASISSLIGQGEGTLFCEMYTNPSGTESLAMWPRDSTSGTYGTFIYFGTNSNAAPRVQVVVSGIQQTEIVGTTLSVGWHKFAFAYKNNDYAFYVDGVQIGTSSSGTAPTNMDELFLDQYFDGGIRNASKRQAVLFKTRLTNAELAQLTA